MTAFENRRSNVKRSRTHSSDPRVDYKPYLEVRADVLLSFTVLLQKAGRMERVENEQQEELVTPVTGRRSSRARKPSQKVLASGIPKGSDSSDTSIFDMESDEEDRLRKRTRFASSRGVSPSGEPTQRPQKRRASAATHLAHPSPTSAVPIQPATRVQNGVQLWAAAATANASVSLSTPITAEAKPFPPGFAVQIVSFRKRQRKQKSPRQSPF